MHAKRHDILGRLREAGRELRVTSTVAGTYAAFVVDRTNGRTQRVAVRHALGIIRTGHVERAGSRGPGVAGVYRLSDIGRYASDPERREEKIITANALRFDGYLYVEENRLGKWHQIDEYSRVLDLGPETDSFLSSPDYSAPTDYLRFVLFFIQRKHIRERWLRWNTQLARITRQLFIRTCREEVPDRFRLEPYATDWTRKYASHAPMLIRFVESRDAATVYTDEFE